MQVSMWSTAMMADSRKMTPSTCPMGVICNWGKITNEYVSCTANYQPLVLCIVYSSLFTHTSSDHMECAIFSFTMSIYLLIRSLWYTQYHSVFHTLTDSLHVVLNDDNNVMSMWHVQWHVNMYCDGCYSYHKSTNAII